MTPQEQQLLMQLTQRINQTRLEEKDPDAENLLGRELGANPDAIYILAQSVLVQNIALDQARAQIAQLQQVQAQPAHSTSFLGRLLGEHETPQAPQSPMAQPSQQGWQPVPQYQAPAQYQQPQYAAAPSGQPSFLRGAMQTAAGVAAGALAFEGVESVLHGLGHEYGMGGFGMGSGVGMMGGGFERPMEGTVVNNYYGSEAPGNQGGEHRFDGGNQFAGLGGTGLHDASFAPTGGAGSNDLNAANAPGADAALQDTGYDTSADDVQFDDSGQEEASNLDDGGGFDDSDVDLS